MNWWSARASAVSRGTGWWLPEAGWQTVADHHLRLWAAVRVEARSLHAYEEVAHANAG